MCSEIRQLFLNYKLYAFKPNTPERKGKRAKFRRYLKQKGRCCFCSRRMIMSFDQHKAKEGLLATWEHVNPTAAGGNNLNSNRKLSCFRCNNARGVIPYQQFYRLVQKQTPWNIIASISRSFSEDIRQQQEAKKAGKFVSWAPPLPAKEHAHA